eukprot:Gregarina_sp_Poly_1__10074@NODE_67_length_16383_cov_69_023903_g57_i0_p6_GENE_NODE_67_length_16383_cov_69_023903_g57_i0NODE_67_length_16383_cov_69_023903_g57_i0_p6_ORF_typecomplete_len274_score48_59TP_methylase/PF00590_20/3_7e46PhoH/PF02562_16/0_067Hydantoinase_A/PF01968_18/0_27_NODE_67_length_16383_cov_69_023903_g57_i026203441
MLHFIGLGLGSEEDITLRGIKTVQKCSKLYLESYTSVLASYNKERLAELYGKPVIEADREFIEVQCESMLEEAKTGDIGFLVVGDPFGATTHADLLVRAKELGVEVSVVHNASILNAIGCTGLQLYRFGQTVSIPFFDGHWKPRSFVDKISQNMNNGFHTLALLDIKIKEQTVENMVKGNNIFEPPRFMTINQAIDEILYFDECNACDKHTKAIGVARIGSPDQLIVSGTLEELRRVDFGKELHSLVICDRELHDMEKTFFDLYHVSHQSAQQ